MLAISDEPYRPLVYDGMHAPETLAILERAVLAWSWSKAMAIAGERIGYLAISPRLAEAAALRNACTFANRILGYINAPALWQRVVARGARRRHQRGTLPGQARSAVRTRFRPWATTRLARRARFTFFPGRPYADDLAFIRLLQNEGILAVPGRGFGRGGYMRLSLTISREEIERSLPGFEKAIQMTR